MKERSKNITTSERFREALLESGLSQQEVADKTGMNKVSVSQYVNGVHSPGLKKAGKLALIFNCNPLWLMGKDVPKENNKSTSFENLKNYIANTKMTDEEQEELLNYAKYIVSKRK